MKLTLGPVLFHWPAATWRDFYFRIADEAPIDTVVVGEVVCSKRAPSLADHIPAVVERLAGAGKEVLLGSLALVTLERERRATAALVEANDAMVEANDVSCLAHLRGSRHVIGPFVQVYNEATAAYFAGRGAVRICLPPELPATSIAAIAAAVPDVVIEVFAFGRVPLAISARCYHARVEGLSKDNCRFVCKKDPDGLVVETLDRELFVAVNGVQTLSHTCANLIGDLADLSAIGVGACRLSPQSCDMVAVAQAFRDVLEGRLDHEEGQVAVNAIFPQAPASNGFLHGKPGAEWIRRPISRQAAAGAADRERAHPAGQ
jgi:collagenase-like PrtC family protease